MRSRVFFPLCLTGLLLACASGGARPTSSGATQSDGGAVQPCSGSAPSPESGTQVLITVNSDGKVHFSTTKVEVQAGQTVSFVSQVQEDRCIAVSDGRLLDEGSQNPLPVPACTSASWTLRAGDAPGTKTLLWSCPKSDCSKCTQPPESEGIRETINGTLEVSGRGQD